MLIYCCGEPMLIVGITSDGFDILECDLCGKRTDEE